jgi:hypothetical protein
MMTAKLLAVAAAAGLLIGTTSLSCAQGAKDSAPGPPPEKWSDLKYVF